MVFKYIFNSMLKSAVRSIAAYNYLRGINCVTLTLYGSICVMIILRYYQEFEYRRILYNLAPVIYISLVLKFTILIASIIKGILEPVNLVILFKFITFSEQVALATFLILMLYFFIQSFRIEISLQTYFYGVIFIIIDLIISEDSVQSLVGFLGLFSGLSSLLILNMTFAINMFMFTIFFLIISILRGVSYGFRRLFGFSSAAPKEPHKTPIKMIDMHKIDLE